MKRLLYSLLIGAFLLVVAGCSQKKNTAISRSFHNVTSYFNGYFNAREIIKESTYTLRQTHVDDYESVLPLYLVPAEDEVASMIPEMDRVIEKCTRVIQYHSINVRGKEHCKWIDENYLCIGIAQFYKGEFEEAAKTFNYTIKQYKHPSTVPTASAWLVRTYVEAEENEKARIALDELMQLEDLDSKQEADRFKAASVYYTANENYAESAKVLEQGVGFIKKKKDYVKAAFTLAQLYQRAGDGTKAMAYYKAVADKANDYELVFNARISQALSVETRAGGYSVKGELLRMIDEDKNEKYLGQIYYALAELSFKERKYKDAVEYLVLSTEKATNPKQKSKSFLRLADYFFTQKNYIPSQQYYDSALASISPDFPNYALMKIKSEDLRELVGHLNVIQREDSLLALAALGDDERKDRINEIYKGILRAEEEAAAKAASGTGTPSTTIPTTTSSTPGGWYFYNTSAKGTGLNEFKRKWGDRPLEDNWRRSSKVSGGAFADNDAGDTGAETASAGDEATAAGITKADLMKDIPLTVTAQEEAYKKLLQALYDAGVTYKEKFKDTDNAIESFENLLSRPKSEDFELEATYQLYRLYVQKENADKNTSFMSFGGTKSSSEFHKSVILTQYPESEFARIIRQGNLPSETEEQIKEVNEKYKFAFNLYKNSEYVAALVYTDSILRAEPANLLAAKYLFLKTKLYSELREVDRFISTLSLLATSYASTEEGKKAKEILEMLGPQLKELSKKDSTVSASLASADSSIASSEKAAEEVAEAELSANPFKEKDDEVHYYVITYPKNDMKTTELKYDIADFHTKYYSNKKFDVTNAYLGSNDTILIVIKLFKDKAESVRYHKVFSTPNKELKKLLSIEGIHYFSINQTNFITLYRKKNPAQYQAFFEEKYMK